MKGPAWFGLLKNDIAKHRHDDFERGKCLCGVGKVTQREGFCKSVKPVGINRIHALPPVVRERVGGVTHFYDFSSRDIAVKEPVGVDERFPTQVASDIFYGKNGFESVVDRFDGFGLKSLVYIAVAGEQERRLKRKLDPAQIVRLFRSKIVEGFGNLEYGCVA